MKPLKVTYIVSDIDKSLAFEWTAHQLSLRFDLFFILIADKQNTQLARYLAKQGIAYTELLRDQYPNPLMIWLRLFRIFRDTKPDVIHTHLWRATLLGLSAAWMAGVPKRITTRHHAMVHHHQHRSGLKWDKLCNHLATDIVAISNNVRNILIELEKVEPAKVRVIHHGFDLDLFRNVDERRVDVIREKHSIPKTFPVVGVISRYTEWKGVQYIIPAFVKLKADFPDAHLILANAHGDFLREIKEQLQALPHKSFTEILFEDDLPALYKCFDLFVHTPVDAASEAFGQTYVEALAARRRCVFTLSGVASEFVQEEMQTKIVAYRNSGQIYQALTRLITHPSPQNEDVYQDKLKRFALPFMIQKLSDLYSSDRNIKD
jgi:glycosyltransferase involved in cell wall biosynthesis